MLKETLYLEYQKRYGDYVAAHRKVDELKSEAEIIRREGEEENRTIERRKRAIGEQLKSVRKDGTKSSVFQEYSERKLQEMKSIEERITQLKSEKKRIYKI